MSNNQDNQHPMDPELISAFYDGEVTAGERSTVEQWMGDTSDTLQTLDDYDQLSQSLKALHQSAGSPDLREAVMSQIATPTSTSTEPAVRPRGRRLLSLVAGIAGLAAAVTLLLWPAGDSQVGERLAQHDYAPGGTGPADADFGDASADGIALAPGASEMAMAPASAARGLSTLEMEANVGSSLADLTREESLPEIGQVVGYLDKNADEITWVAVTVVDAQAAGDRVQLLLSQHGVQSPDKASPAIRDQRLQLQQEQQPGARMAFLVEADWDQMRAVIRDLESESFVDAMVVDAARNEDVPKELQGYSMQRERSGRSANPDEESAKTKTRETVGRIAANEPKAAPVETLSDTTGKSDTDSALQLQMFLPDDALKRIVGRRGQPDSAAKGSAVAEGSSLPRIGHPLGSTRQKAVFVIRELDE